MGYFSNGTEGVDYQERYCVRCVHDINENCPVWLIHLLYNYDAAGKNADEKLKTTLDTLIPRNGLGNDQCKMFVERGKPVETQSSGWRIEGLAPPPGSVYSCSCGRALNSVFSGQCTHLEPGRMF